MPLYSTFVTDRFVKSTEAAFSATLTYLIGKYIPDLYTPVAVCAFGTYYFFTQPVEDIYIDITYYYRTMGPGFFDFNGVFIDDYEILRQVRTTKEGHNIGGQITHRIESSTIVEPWF